MTHTTDKADLSRPIEIGTRTYPPAKVRGISSSSVKNDTEGLLPQIRLQPEETKIILLYAMRYCLGR